METQNFTPEKEVIELIEVLDKDGHVIDYKIPAEEPEKKDVPTVH